MGYHWFDFLVLLFLRKQILRLKADDGYVSVYEFDLDAASAETSIKKFEKADIEWLMFVVDNRKGIRFKGNIDMHIGPVADDSVYASIRLFEANIINAEATIKRLKTEVLQDQVVFHTEKILRFCKFIECKKRIEKVMGKIRENEIWLPKDEIIKLYCSKVSHFRKRLEKEINS